MPHPVFLTQWDQTLGELTKPSGHSHLPGVVGWGSNHMGPEVVGQEMWQCFDGGPGVVGQHKCVVPERLE